MASKKKRNKLKISLISPSPHILLNTDITIRILLQEGSQIVLFRGYICFKKVLLVFWLIPNLWLLLHLFPGLF